MSDARELAAQSFNEVWSLLEQPAGPERDAALRDAAHASRYLWGLVGGPEHRARADWLLARVYLALGDAGLAAGYAQSCLAICQSAEVADWDQPAAWEIVARTALATGDRERAAEALAVARERLRQVSDPDDAAVVQADIDETTRLLG